MLKGFLIVCASQIQLLLLLDGQPLGLFQVEPKVDHGDYLEETEAVKYEVEAQLPIDQASGKQRLYGHGKHHAE